MWPHLCGGGSGCRGCICRGCCRLGSFSGRPTPCTRDPVSGCFGSSWSLASEWQPPVLTSPVAEARVGARAPCSVVLSRFRARGWVSEVLGTLIDVSEGWRLGLRPWGVRLANPISHRVVPSFTPILQMGNPRLESEETYSGFTKWQSWGLSLSRPDFSNPDYLFMSIS